MSGFLDLNAWSRREHYELFRSAAQPWFSITTEVDVTTLRSRCAEQSRSFFLSALYACLRAGNDTLAFRLRLRGAGVWLHDRLGVTSTILREDDTFAFGRFDWCETLEEFLRAGTAEMERARRVRALALPHTDDDALIYHSTVPWLRFTSFTNAITDTGDSVPRVVFGRCTAEGKRELMPVSVEVHHALVDGIDVGRFIDRLQGELASG